jgi:glycerophosphoryl diester phosphodiesterase
MNARNVKEARALGLGYGVWTVNTARDMRGVLNLGVDAICTDRPDRLRTLLYSPSNKAVER